MISIMAPLNETCEIDELNRYADEYYAGIADGEWHRATDNLICYNTRGNQNSIASFHDWARLQDAIRKAGTSHRPVYLTVNGHNLDHAALKIIRRIIRDFAAIGGSGVICSELNGLVYAKEEGLKAVLSTNMALYNLRAIQYVLRTYPVDRVVLSRDMTLPEIRHIRENLEIEIETFGMNFGCRFSNGLCFGTHNHPTGGLCRAIRSAQWDFYSPDGEALEEDLRYEADVNFWNYSRNFLVTACGLCGLYALNDMGIDSFKIVGRELCGDRILEAAKTADRVRQMAVHSPNEPQFLEQVRSAYRAEGRYGCKWGYQCYYREKYRD